MTTIKPARDLAVRAAVAARTEALLRASGALRDGHFELRSGRHSETWLDRSRMLEDPAATSELCAFWAQAYRDREGRATVDVVVGPPMGGVILAFETARQLGVRVILAEEAGDADGSPRRALRRGLAIRPAERVLVVDDVFTAGGSLLAMLPAIEAAGGEIVGCHVLVDRSAGRAVLTSPASRRSYPLRGLWRFDPPTFEPGPASCPRCADGTPLEGLGSGGTGVTPSGDS